MCHHRTCQRLGVDSFFSKFAILFSGPRNEIEFSGMDLIKGFYSLSGRGDSESFDGALTYSFILLVFALTKKRRMHTKSQLYWYVVHFVLFHLNGYHLNLDKDGLFQSSQ